ncbi:MAG: phage terminase large subunit family protein, partial [Proteobacteria bacterium]|nr:phage terminase large subunit family protein [Pseudomonadota bacterium]
MTAKQGDRAVDHMAALFGILPPPPKWTISEWADHRRKLSGEAAAEKGQWRTNRAEYQRGIMDAVADPTIEQVVVMSSAQVGKTEILLNCIGYFVDFDPSPLMLV